MSRPILALFLLAAAVLLCPAAGLGDTLYLDDGSELTGKVTKKGQTYHLVDADGKTHVIPAAKVFYVAGESAPPPPPPADDGSARESAEPSTPPVAHDKTPPDEPASALETASSHEHVSHGEVALPESILFALYRQKLTHPDRAASIDRTIRKYRRLAHEKQRQAGRHWVTQEDFAKARQLFLQRNTEAQEFWKKAQSALPKDEQAATAAEQKEYQTNLTEATKLHDEAARTWLDPTIQSFLRAEAARRSDDTTRAIALYSRLVAAQPDMPVYRQGYALALLANGRDEQALREAMTAAALAVGQSRYGLGLMRHVMDNSGGSAVNFPTFERARTMLKGESSRRSRRQRKLAWLFPGDRETDEEGALPAPPADRYTIRQAVAVPVGPHRVIVPAWAVAGVEQAAIRIDADTYLGVEVSRRDSRSRDPLVILDVPGASFSPVETTVLSSGQAAVVELYAANVFAEMGSTLRQFPAELTPRVGGEATISTGILPGESAGAIFHQGKLAGFLAGKTDAMTKTFSDRMISDKDFRDALDEAGKKSRHSSADSSGLPPKAAAGRVFLLRAIVPETFHSQ